MSDTKSFFDKWRSATFWPSKDDIEWRHAETVRGLGSIDQRLDVVEGLLAQPGIKNRRMKVEELAELFPRFRPYTTDTPLIRCGGEGDGGYLIPDDLSGIEACFSPGVNDIAHFETDMVERGIRCFLADASVNSSPVYHPLIEFDKLFLGANTQGSFVTLDDWIAGKNVGNGDLLLQMDIEGAEYDVLFAAQESTLRRCRIMVIEFHHLTSLLDPLGAKLIQLCFDKLLRLFDIVHIHPNNCCPPSTLGPFTVPPVMEFTFLRKDRVKKRVPTSRFPHELDRPNVAIHEDIELPRCWYG
ncbi:MAG: hypothetical protein CTY15_07450 [Methylocystis sp.]|nr:MAG: hypothetical protein CTY15_07450 [Methylocystis sp.]